MHIKSCFLYMLIVIVLFVIVVITYGSIHIASIYGLASRFILFMNSFTFRHGVTTGILGCLFLTSILLLFLTIARKISTRNLRLVILTFASSFLGFAIFWYSKPGDSDTWWVGAVAGYLICEAIVLPLIIYITYKLFHKLTPKLVVDCRVIRLSYTSL